MSKNDQGVYLDYQTESVATLGRARAGVDIAKCDDGLYRFSIGISYSYGGFSGPITDDGEGHATRAQAKSAGMDHLLKRWPEAWESEPESVHKELRLMRQLIESQLRQPSLL